MIPVRDKEKFTATLMRSNILNLYPWQGLYFISVDSGFILFSILKRIHNIKLIYC